MSREWKPGDTIPQGGVTVTFHWNEVAMQLLLDALRAEYRSGYLAMGDDFAAAINGRGPVVIDPEDREQVDRLRVLFNEVSGQNYHGVWTSDMQAALREFANPKPPRPEEPQGLGAVVEDKFGVLWVRAPRDGDPDRREWVCSHSTTSVWLEIDEPRILHEGMPS